MSKKQKVIIFLALGLVSLIVLFGLGNNAKAQYTTYTTTETCTWNYFCNIWYCNGSSGPVCACGGQNCMQVCGKPAAGSKYGEIYANSCTGAQSCTNSLPKPTSTSRTICHYIGSWTACPNPQPNWTTLVGNSCSNADPPSCNVDGKCGTANGNSFSVAPVSGRCSAGSASATSGDGSAASPWKWVCKGTGTGIDSGSCEAYKLPTLNLSGLPLSVYSGQPSTLTWTTTNAARCTATAGWAGSKAAAGGSEQVFPTATTTYSLQCFNIIDDVSPLRSVTVSVLLGPEVFLNPSSQIKNPGDSATISWNSLRSNAVEATDPPGWTSQTGTSGLETFTPTHTGNKTYKMKSKNNVGIYSPEKSATVCVRNNDCSSANTICQGTPFTVPNGCDSTNCVGTQPPGCGPYSGCSVSCGGGTQTETNCVCGAVPKTRACNTQPCPPGYKEVTPW